jgi:hypothetical protein
MEMTVVRYLIKLFSGPWDWEFPIGWGPGLGGGRPLVLAITRIYNYKLLRW